MLQEASCVSVFGLDQPCHHAPEDGGIHRQAAAGEDTDAGGDQAPPGGNRGAERHHPVRTGDLPGMEQQLQRGLGQTAGSVCSVAHQGADGCWTEQSCCQLQAPSRVSVGWALVQTVWVFSKL